MAYKIGLKLWSLNENYINSAITLYENGVYDYIELYAVPNSLDKISIWTDMKSKFNIPFAIHAPHFSSGLDFSNKDKFSSNLKLVELTRAYSLELDAIYTIFHPGIGGKVDESIRQINSIKDFKFIIENKPYVVPMNNAPDAFCIGSTIEMIKKIIDQTGHGFCLDIGHALASANYQKLDPYEYILEFNSLKPSVYHLSDNDSTSIYDAHLHFGDGNIDFKKIHSIIDKDKFLAIETIKDSKENLDDFIKDSKFIKELK